MIRPCASFTFDYTQLVALFQRQHVVWRAKVVDAAIADKSDTREKTVHFTLKHTTTLFDEGHSYTHRTREMNFHTRLQNMRFEANFPIERFRFFRFFRGFFPPSDIKHVLMQAMSVVERLEGMF